MFLQLAVQVQWTMAEAFAKFRSFAKKPLTYWFGMTWNVDCRVSHQNPIGDHQDSMISIAGDSLGRMAVAVHKVLEFRRSHGFPRVPLVGNEEISGPTIQSFPSFEKVR